ncbi:Uncharacterised protein [Mycobacteroides abscessus subsp. abscessus]|nr:Uncharacterised protein [Mycobacteroides abscessus subsp. abscessus]
MYTSRDRASRSTNDATALRMASFCASVTPGIVLRLKTMYLSSPPGPSCTDRRGLTRSVSISLGDKLRYATSMARFSISILRFSPPV